MSVGVTTDQKQTKTFFIIQPCLLFMLLKNPKLIDLPIEFLHNLETRFFL
jgi:hypothetical protein